MVANSQLVPVWPFFEFAELSKLLILETFYSQFDFGQPTASENPAGNF